MRDAISAATATAATAIDNTWNSNARIFLPLSTQPPDHLGFANVSGFYGPGAWTGWFLTIAASWLHLFRARDGGGGTETNLWTFLALLNWAAVDLIRHGHKLYTLDQRSLLPGEHKELRTTGWMKEAASTGAALNVVFWGSWHAFAQLLVSAALVWYGRRKIRARAFVLCFGAVLPFVSLLVVTYYLAVAGGSEEAFDVLPALYWEGMRVYTMNGVFPVSHSGSFFFVCCLGAAGCLLLVTLGIASNSKFLYRYWALILKSIGYYRPGWRKVFIALYLVCYIAMIPFLRYNACRIVFFIVYSPLSLPMTMGSLIIMIAVFAVQYSTGYIWGAYITGSINRDNSCFYMPCSSQSIGELDQAFALFIGLLLFLGIEIGLPAYERLNKEREKRRYFETEMEMRLESARMHQQGQQDQQDQQGQQGQQDQRGQQGV